MLGWHEVQDLWELPVGPARNLQAHCNTSPKVNLEPQLSSLSWPDGTPDLRVKFIDAVSVRDLWQSMSFEQKSALINLINAEQDARNAVRAAP